MSGQANNVRAPKGDHDWADLEAGRIFGDIEAAMIAAAGMWAARKAARDVIAANLRRIKADSLEAAENAATKAEMVAAMPVTSAARPKAADPAPWHRPRGLAHD